MDSSSFLVGLAGALREVLRPLEEALESPVELAVLLRQHGWHIDGDATKAVQELTQRLRLGDRVPVLEAALGGAIGLDVDGGQADAVMSAAMQAIGGIGDLVSVAPASDVPVPLNRPEFWGTFPVDLAHSLFATYLEFSQPVLFATLQVLGVIDRQRVPSDGTPGRVAYTRVELRWGRLGDGLTDPVGLAHEVYGWGGALDDGKLTENLERALFALGTPAQRRLAGHALLESFYAPGNPVLAEVREVRAPLTVHREIDGSRVELGLVLLPIPKRSDPHGVPVGVLIGPYAYGEFDAQVPLGGLFELEFKGGLEADEAVGVELRPGSVMPRLTASSTVLDAAVTLTGAPFSPWIPVGHEDANRVEVHDVALGLEVKGTPTDPEIRVRVGTDRLDVVIDLDEGDGFLRSLLGGGKHSATTAPALVWSSKHGLSFEGSAGLTLDLPVDVSVGGARITRLSLTIAAAQGVTSLSATATANASLGPVFVVVQGVGTELRLATVAAGRRRGNFGALDVSFGFKAPTLLGLSIDAGPVTGGGFLSFDPQREEYAGALELQFGTIGVKAIGMLTTGPGDWSLMLLLYAQIPPIQLGFGFTLDGIGGLVGLQRGVNLGQLIAGMKTRAFDDLLFPEDPVRQAPQILERVRTVFPVRAGCLTIGPMIDGGWGTPRIVFLRLAVLVQLDNVLGGGSGAIALTQVVVIGNVRVAIGPNPGDPDTAVVVLIVDVVGFWDVADKRFAFLARLRDSNVAGIDLSGGMGVYGEYGDHPRFLLSAGGFNPRFEDVPALMRGTLDRLGASFSVGRFSLVLTGYFAVTPATIQAGMNLVASAKIGPVGLKGEIGFDVLVYLRPDTHFIADFHVIAEVTYHGHTLAGVKVTGTIEGPGRWHIAGKVTFSILWWDISKSFNESWGDVAALLLAPVSVVGLLVAEVAKPENWSAQLPAGADAMVTLAPRRDDPTLRAHPLGRFVFSQRVAPLGLTLEKYGENPIAGPNRFDVTSVTVGAADGRRQDVTGRSTMVREHFARSQFLKMSEEDKLTRPSFEEIDSGVEFSSAAFEVSQHPLRATLDYDTAYVDFATQQVRRAVPATLKRAGLEYDRVQELGRHGAAGRAPQRASEQMRDQTDRRICLSAPRLAAADRRTFSPIAIDGQATSVQMIAEQRLRATGSPRSQIVEAFELAGA
jgi:hypothetical protein